MSLLDALAANIVNNTIVSNERRARILGGQYAGRDDEVQGSQIYRNANAATLRLVERFTRTSPDRLEWAVTVNDPTTWTRPGHSPCR